MDATQQAKRARYLKTAIKRATTARSIETSSIERAKIARRIKALQDELTPLLAALGAPVTVLPVSVKPARTDSVLAQENELLRDALQWLFNESTHYLHTSTKSQSIERAITNARQVLAR